MSFSSFRIAFSILILFAGSQAFAQADTVMPRCNSLLWEISGNGLERPSYLYGTMHVSSKVAFHLTDTFFVALNKCNAIALEEDPGTWMEQLVESGFMMESRSNSFTRRNQNFYKSAFQVDLPDNKDISQTLSFRSDLINNLLYRFYSREGNSEENTYLDLFIYQCGKKIGKPVIGLESFEEGQEYSARASRPDSVKAESETYIGSAREIREQIEDAYRKGDLDLLDSLSRLSSRSKNMQKFLIDERNRIFVNRMDSVMRSGTSVFTGVGAAHLPGSNGVIHMLQKKGYHIRAVAFTQSKKADKEKQKIENTFRPNVYTQRFFPDSSVSLQAPGKMYKLVGGANSFYIYPDMVNGAYYSVFAMNRFEAFSRQGTDYTMKRIDSLLYENIPGKILTNKTTRTPEGYPAIDITNRNRRGDVSRYHIVVTPEYIYFFMVNGTGDYVLERSDDKFFQTIRLAPPAGSRQWSRVYGENGRYSLEMPSRPFSDVAGSDNALKTNDAFIHCFDAADSSYHLFIRNDYPDVEYLEDDTFELTQLASEFAEQFDMIVDSVVCTASRNEAHPSLQAVLHNDTMRFLIRIVIQGPYYNLLCCKPGKGEDPQRFLSSFRAEPVNYATAFETVTDTAMHFSVTSFPEQKMIRSIRALRAYDDDNDDDGDYAFDKVKKRTFRSPASDEYIVVTYRKFTPFYQCLDPDTFWRQRIDILNDDSSLIIASQIASRKDSLYCLSLLFADTACSRGIRCKLILNRDVLYTLTTPVDTLMPLSPWATTFFNSFAPTDTLKAESIFRHKSDRFFEYLCSDDTVKSRLARRNIWRATLDSTNVPQLIAWLSDPASLKCQSSYREDALRRIGLLHHPESVPFLDEWYAASSDSSNIQLAILRGLAACQTTQATLAFRELLLNEAPLASDDYSITRMFRGFFDTLELATKLYPQVLRLTRYPEYKPALYSLLAASVMNGKIRPAVYESWLPDILHDANDDLKREFHSENSKGSSNRDLERALRQASGGFVAPGIQDENGKYAFRSTTDDFAIMLVPYYEKNPGVKKYFDKLQKSKNKELVMRSYVLMLNNSVPVTDSIWKRLSSAMETRAPLYAELEKQKHLERVDSSFKGQAGITESQMYKDLDWDNDSILFLEKRLVRSRRDTGFVYIYKFQREKSGKWFLGYNYLQPLDTTRAHASADSRSEVIKDMTKLNKQISRICKKVALEDRPRAGGGRYGNPDDD